MRGRVRGRLRRDNPLRRRSDVVEAWTALFVAVLLLVAVPLAGALAGRWGHADAQAVADRLRAERHRERVEVVGHVPETMPSVEGVRQQMFRVTVRWTPPGEHTRTATARVPAGTREGEVVDVWFDTRGRSVAPPPNDTLVWQHAFAMGACAAGGTAAVVLLGHAVVRRVAMRHRLGEWEREWARTEPQWTRRRPA
ncbi:Rv1733c family protein [Streptomyces sp. NPDC002755]|uniref:Rv1733c family protein n=1 Tax=Streptomyces sp. NPDC002884 TaxID=3154544 RepID=UPI00332004A0